MTKPATEPRRLLAALAVLCGSLAALASAAETEVGGDARLFSFYSLDELPPSDDETPRRDLQRGALRLKLEQDAGARFSLEVHGLAEVLSPPDPSLDPSLHAAESNRYFDLEVSLRDPGEDPAVILSIDRIALRYEGDHVRVIAGRQPVTWGVNYFWPVLDLFGPFRPEQIDRDYKPGIDAVRTVVPLGEFSEVEAIVAAQGPDLSQDLGYGSLARLHVGRADLGLMAGRFHGDVVLGSFFVTDVAGTGVRAEVSHTDAGDGKLDLDPALERDQFWRATLGFDRQLGPYTTLVAEASFNGFGTTDPALYPALARAPRVRRGEITSLGRYYAALSLQRQITPRWSGSGALLLNAGDGSALLQPAAVWSLTQSVDTLLGVTIGFGEGLDERERPGSEYGAVPTTVWAAIKAYF